MKEEVEVEVGSVTAIHQRTTINKTPLCALRPLCETAGALALHASDFLSRTEGAEGTEVFC